MSARQAASSCPYFPGYIFVRADLETVKRSIFDRLPNTQGLIHFGGTPGFVPDAMIVAMRKQLERNAAESLCTSQGSEALEQSFSLDLCEKLFQPDMSGAERVGMLLGMLQFSIKPAEPTAAGIK